MKIRVVLTLDVDHEMYELAYGTAHEDVRAEVKEYVRQHVRGWFGEAGLLLTGADEVA